MCIYVGNMLLHQYKVQKWGCTVGTTAEVNPFCLISIYISKSVFFAQASQGRFWERWLDGSMMKWGEIRSCERQNPTVSYEQLLSLIWVDPHRALTGPVLLTPAPGAQLTSVVQTGDVSAGINVHRRKSCIIVDSQTWLWLMLSTCGRYIPCSNGVNCIWCKCFPNQTCCLEQTCFLDWMHLWSHKPSVIAVEFETDDIKSLTSTYETATPLVTNATGSTNVFIYFFFNVNHTVSRTTSDAILAQIRSVLCKPDNNNLQIPNL